MELIIEGGGRVLTSENRFINNISQAVSELYPDQTNIRISSEQRNVIARALDFTMQYWVPRLKMAAMAKQIGWELERLDVQSKQDGTDMSGAEYKDRQLQVVQAGVRNADNIYGQMVYDNLSMRKSIKDALRFIIAFPGWNIGSVTKFLGAAELAAGKITNPFVGAMQKTGLGTET